MAVVDNSQIERLSELDRSKLHIFVCGPGQGEGLALALPGQGWLTVDGCPVDTRSTDRTLPLTRILRRWKDATEPVVASVLTHPHQDHAFGFAELLEEFDPQRVVVPGTTGSQTLAQQNRAWRDLVVDAADTRLNRADLNVTTCEPRPSQVDGTETIPVLEGNSSVGRDVVEVCQELELDDGLDWAICYPSPHTLIVRLEFSVAKSSFQALPVYRSGGNFKVHLHVHLGRARVPNLASAAQKLRNKATHEDELGAFSVVMNDPNEGAFGGRARPGYVIRPRITSRKCSAASSPRTPAIRRSA